MNKGRPLGNLTLKLDLFCDKAQTAQRGKWIRPRPCQPLMTLVSVFPGNGTSCHLQTPQLVVELCLWHYGEVLLCHLAFLEYFKSHVLWAISACVLVLRVVVVMV